MVKTVINNTHSSLEEFLLCDKRFFNAVFQKLCVMRFFEKWSEWWREYHVIAFQLPLDCLESSKKSENNEYRLRSYLFRNVLVKIWKVPKVHTIGISMKVMHVILIVDEHNHCSKRKSFQLDNVSFKKCRIKRNFHVRITQPLSQFFRSIRRQKPYWRSYFRSRN